ncbi:helix-turn-helix transcriptional regulator [Melissococcus plutonius]|uniref:helix-turn-helix transcriptional regulator n=1 Tax=Melissococcus plutonius TaxID=33970 RepID=UPI003C2C3CC5
MVLKEKERLFDLRISKRMTQRELTKKTGLTEKTIITYESSIEKLRNASYKNVEKVANALDVGIDDIFLSSVSEKPKKERRENNE